MYSRNFGNWRRISDAHAITIVTEDPIRTIVLNVAIGTSRLVSPRGQSGDARPDQDVARKQGAEQHHFRRQEEPDADLAAGQAGVPANLVGVGNLHRESGLVLRHEVLGRAGNAVLVRPAVCLRGRGEIAMRRRRRRRPLDGRGLPHVVLSLLPVPDAPEEIEDEGKLEERHRSTRPTRSRRSSAWSAAQSRRPVRRRTDAATRRPARRRTSA